MVLLPRPRLFGSAIPFYDHGSSKIFGGAFRKPPIYDGKRAGPVK
jgi:hypothetical protein